MDLLELYRSLRSEALRELRQAFVRDRDNGADAAFCDGRIALLDRVLKERHEEART